MTHAHVSHIAIFYFGNCLIEALPYYKTKRPQRDNGRQEGDNRETTERRERERDRKREGERYRVCTHDMSMQREREVKRAMCIAYQCTFVYLMISIHMAYVGI